MKHLEAIKNKILPIVNQHDLNLVDIAWEKMGHQKVLNISLADAQGTLDLETASVITQPISDALDELDELDFEYILDIGSPGIEKELSSYDDMIGALNQYVRATLSNGDILEGILIDVDDKSIIIKHFIKGRPSKQVLLFENIEKLQLAVKV